MTPPDERAVTVGLRWVVIGVALLVCGGLLGVIVSVGGLRGLDEWWDQVVTNLAFLVPLSRAGNAIGGGRFAVFVVPLCAAGLLVALRRPWAALCVLVALGASAAGVQALKDVFGRARPDDILVVADYGSFPSGHTANVATIAVIAVILVPRGWVAAVGCASVAAMALSRTVLHAHWLSDTVGGALVGAGFAMLVCGVFSAPLRREHPFPPRDVGP